MLSDEAPSHSEPQIYESKKTANKKRNKTLFILIVLMFFLVANNFIIYNWYHRAKHQYKDTFLRVQSISEENVNLQAFNETLKSDYALLMENYSKVLKQYEEILKQLEELKAKNEDLERANSELVNDNIELQNSLKKAASVGIKPQSYTEFNGISTRSAIDRGEYIGKFLGTAYTPCTEECGNNKGITNSGKPIIPGVSIAVDKNYWPFGTVFYIKGLGYAVAMDTGSAIKGKYRFDFAVFDKNFAKQLGTNYWDVYLVKLGNGKVEDISL